MLSHSCVLSVARRKAAPAKRAPKKSVESFITPTKRKASDKTLLEQERDAASTGKQAKKARSLTASVNKAF